MQEATLRCDVHSNFNKSKKYGSKNDRVKIIYWNGSDMWVVEKDGERFPVKTEELSFKTNC